RATNFVTGQSADVWAQTRPNGRLPSHVLAQPRADDVAENDLLDLLGWNCSSRHGGFYHRAPQRRRRNRFESPAKAAYGRTHPPGQINSVNHVHRSLLKIWVAVSKRPQAALGTRIWVTSVFLRT